MQGSQMRLAIEAADFTRTRAAALNFWLGCRWVGLDLQPAQQESLMPSLRTLGKQASSAVRTLKKKVTNVRKAAARPEPWKAVPEDELGDIGTRMKEAFKWEHSPHEFQEQGAKCQLMRKDVLVHAGTGRGKTVIAAGPHAHPAAKGKVTLLVSPLIALQEEQVRFKIVSLRSKTKTRT